MRGSDMSKASASWNGAGAGRSGRRSCARDAAVALGCDRPQAAPGRGAGRRARGHRAAQGPRSRAQGHRRQGWRPRKTETRGKGLPARRALRLARTAFSNGLLASVAAFACLRPLRPSTWVSAAVSAPRSPPNGTGRGHTWRAARRGGLSGQRRPQAPLQKDPPSPEEAVPPTPQVGGISSAPND